MILIMRTTLRIDDDILKAARALAKSQDRSIGEVLSDLARRGLRPDRQRKEDRGFPVFDVSPDAPPLIPEDVERALDEE